MEKLELTSDRIEEIKNREILGSGHFSNVYEYDDNNIIKLWNDKTILIEDSERLLSNILDLDIESDIFLFAKDIVYCNDEFIGYTRKKVDGQVLSEDFLLDYTLEDLYNLLKEIEVEIFRLSLEYDLKMADLKFANMMYDNNLDRVNIIDTDLYRINKDFPDLAGYNLHLFNKSWIIHFIRLELMNYISNPVVKKYLANLMQDNIRFSDLLYIILEEKKDHINSFRDIKKYTLT